MRIKNIEISNFRSIDAGSIECGDVTILIGRNNHGKSNVLAALDFFCGTGAKCKLNDFFKSNDARSSELWVEVTFESLSEQESNTFSKYVSSTGQLKVRKKAVIDEADSINVSYHGWRSEPKIAWLKSEYTNTKKGDLVKELLDLLPEGMRYSKDVVSQAQKRYIENNIDSLEFEYILEDGNFLGKANVASGILPDAFLIPAIRDLNEETKTKTNTLFGRLLNRAMGEMAKSDEGFKKVKEDLAKIVEKLNKANDGKDERPQQLKDLESNLEKELEDWDIKLGVKVTPPDIEKVFELGTELEVDDGVITLAEEKGNGLQRAIIFALTRSWANSLRQKDPEEITPRGASESVYLLIEEPELYLHPHAQKGLAKSLTGIASTIHHQVFLCSHSPIFIDISKYKDIAIVEKKNKNSPSSIRQSRIQLFEGEGNKERKNKFNLGHWINPERAEMFFARKAILVEGATEKVLLPYLAEKLGIYDPTISIVDTGSKFNLSVYMELAGSFDIPHIALHDEDPVKDTLEGDKLTSAQKTYAINSELLELSKKTNTNIEMVKPEFEVLCGISKSQGKTKGKPLAAMDHFEQLECEDYPEHLKNLVRRLYQ